MIEYCQFKALKGQSTREYNGTCPVLLINSTKKCKDSFENKKELRKKHVFMRVAGICNPVTPFFHIHTVFLVMMHTMHKKSASHAS